MLKLIAFFVLLAVISAVPFKGFFNQNRIVGGVQADIKDFPYQVSFRFYDEHICGGSILDKNTILTAAHCTEDLGTRRLTVMVGSDDIEKGDIYEVSHFIQHPLYKNYDYDVSILKLSSPIQFSETVAPIELEEDGVEIPPGTTGVVSGWGGLFEGDEETPYFLRKVELDVISDEECKDAYFADFTDRMLCAKHIGKDSCQGDSGGPFVVNGKQIGIVSWGIGCARPKYPGVYSKVSNLRKWIEANK